MVRRLLHAVLAAFLLVTIGPGPAWTEDYVQDHRDKQDGLVELGTSGGNINDMSAMYCCGGTLGALVEDGSGSQYILSNNHVLARTNSALPEEAITQPGLIDQDPPCDQDLTDTVALLADFVPIRFRTGRRVPINEVDAAIAEVVDGAVDADGTILDIGTLSSSTVVASRDQAVKKSGRTTGLTRGTVSAIDVTLDVGYPSECGGPAKQVARFKNQFIIGPGSFSAGGDSGSLIVEDVDSEPKAVGLLFAGSDTYTVANPIGAVLSALGVTMIGGTPPPPPTPPTATGTVHGTVTSKTDGSPIEGATVTVDTGESATTDAGDYTISNVLAGDRQITATAPGYRSETRTVTVQEGGTTIASFVLKPGKEPPGRGLSKAAMDHARNVKARHGARLFEIPAVVGHGIGLSETGQPVIEVYLEKESAEARAQIPAALNHVPVRVVVTGPFEAF